MELSLGVLFKGFNASKFVLYISLLFFILLLSLRLDGVIQMTYAIVFVPLWTCNLLAFLGAFVGCISYIHRPPSSNDTFLRVEFTAMLFSALEHVLLVAFEVLAFWKLEFGAIGAWKLHWTIVFTPLIVLSFLSIAVSVWAIKHEKGFEFEFFCAINVVQFVFASFRLDDQIDWSWALVFIPLWVVLSLAAVGVVYALVLSIVLARSRHLLPSHRRQHLYSALFQTFLVVPALLCLILLTGKLDAMQLSDKEPAATFPYTVVMMPLIFSLLCMAIMACGRGGGNVWWFAMRRPFCFFLLDSMPCLRQYANVKIRLGSDPESDHSPTPPARDESERPLRTVVPLTSIECVD